MAPPIRMIRISGLQRYTDLDARVKFTLEREASKGNMEVLAARTPLMYRRDSNCVYQQNDQSKKLPHEIVFSKQDYPFRTFNSSLWDCSSPELRRKDFQITTVGVSLTQSFLFSIRTRISTGRFLKDERIVLTNRTDFCHGFRLKGYQNNIYYFNNITSYCFNYLM